MKLLKNAVSFMLILTLLIGNFMIAVNAVTPKYTVSTSYKAGRFYKNLEAVSLTGNQRTDIVNIALSQEEYHESNALNNLSGIATGSGDYTEYGNWYGRHVAWCAIFVSWCAAQASIPTSVIKKTNTPNTTSYGVTSKTYESYKDSIQKGDIAIINNGSHACLVYAVDSTYIYTIDGNWGDSVKKNKYNKSDGKISYYGYGGKNYYKISQIGVPNYKNTTLNPPSWATIAINKTSFLIGENVTFGFASDTATGYTIGIDKGNTRIDTIDCQGTYTRNFSEPGSYSAYVTAWNSAGGKDSNRVYFTVENPVPTKPVIRSLTSDIPVGDAVQITWDSSQYADYYKINVDGNLLNKEIYSLNDAFVLDSPGIKEIRVQAFSKTGNYVLSEPMVVNVHPDVNVRFVVDDIISSEIPVKWNGSLSAMPDTPNKKGYTFIGWYKENETITANFNNLKNDLSVYARFNRNSYAVTFYNPDKKINIDKQTVLFGNAAIEPTGFQVPIGHSFLGWDKAFSFIENDLTVNAVFAWTNSNLKVAVDNATAVRTEDGYTVTFQITNNPSAKTSGRAVVALKTQEDKLLTTTESSAFSLPANGTKQMELFIPYEEAATIAEIYVVEQFKSAVPISQKVFTAVVDGNAWSNWSPDMPPVGSESESRTEYSYRDKDVQKSTNLTMAGYERDDSRTTTSWTPYGNWSDWSETAVAGSDSRAVETKIQYSYKTSTTTPVWSDWSAWSSTPVSPSNTVIVDTPRVLYCYSYYFRCSNCGAHMHVSNACYSWAGGCGSTSSNMVWTEYQTLTPYSSTGWTDWHGTGKTYKYIDGVLVFKWAATASWYNITQYRYKTSTLTTTWSDWSNYSDTMVQPSETCQVRTRTMYRYADRTSQNEYYFFKWFDWIDNGTNPVEASDTREISTATQYRYKLYDLVQEEDKLGVLRTLSGSLGSQYAGKQATLFIYKINEASDWTTEYLGQVILDQDGSYAFAFKLREEPSLKYGDFIATLGIEGSNSAFLIDDNQFNVSLKAPIPAYTVRYLDHDGQVISTQTVVAGGYAVTPAAPNREGYRYIGWDSSNVNITKDTDIRAMYEINMYTVVFIDWTNETYSIQSVKHGNPLTPPPLNDTIEKFAVGWDKVIEGVTSVTSNMVVTAKYETKTYTIDFYDFEMNIVNSQTIEYGETPIEPDLDDQGKYILLGWCDKNTLEQVDVEAITAKQDVTLQPIYVYSETVDTPYTSVPGGEYASDQAVRLLCDTEDADIYYTLDGSDPTGENAIKYTAPINIIEATTLKFFASAAGKNDSSTTEEIYVINPIGDRSGWVLFDSLPSYVRANPSAYTLYSDTAYRYKNLTTTSQESEVKELEAQGWVLQGYAYSDFTAWQDTEIPIDNSLIGFEVESRAVYETFLVYKYSHYKYTDNGAVRYAASEVAGFDGVWEYIELVDMLPVAGFEGGSIKYYIYNGQTWYNQTRVNSNIQIGTEYRSRYQIETYSKWSEITFEQPGENETREHEIVDVYSYLYQKKYIVDIYNFVMDGESDVIRYIVNSGDKVDISGLNVLYGYTFSGLYSDLEYTTEWDVDNDTVTESIILYTKYLPIKCTVTFVDSDDSVLSVQSIDYRDTAEAPAVTPPEGYSFIGWDNEFDVITENLVVKAQYKLTADILKIDLNMTRNVLTVDSMFMLNASVTPVNAENKTVIWSSSDESVAIVDQNGFVTAIGIGKATITAATEVDNSTAVCEITVLSNGEWNIIFDETANLKYICGISTDNKVSNLKTQINNANVRFINTYEDEMVDTDKVGTGCKIQLIEADTVVAEKTFVLYGDVNSDGSIDSIDAGMLVDVENYLIHWDSNEFEAFRMAGDVNGDGSVDSIDAGIVVDAENYKVSINQTTGLAI